MATEKQIAANRRNAKLSSGPRTEAGKNVSRMNALRHGLTQQIEVMNPEEKEAKDKFFDEIISSLAPEGAIEIQFAHSVADGHWRLNRASSIENNIFTLACSLEDSSEETPGDSDGAKDPEVDKALGAARVFIADPKRFQLLTIYEGRIHRNMTKNLQQLTELQAIRRAAEASLKARREQALDEARLHTQLAEIEGAVCDVAADLPENGFAFTTAEIAQAIRRANHLRAAHKAESTNWTWPIRRTEAARGVDSEIVPM
jgi:hypothetical protein